MPVCGLVEKNKPACPQELDDEGVCPVHCCAKTKHGPCRKHHVKGRRRCFKHGGKSKRGIFHGRYKSGEFVKEPRPDARERYKAVITDPELKDAFEESELYNDKLSLRKEIDLLDMRTALLFKRLQNGEGPSLWRQANEAFDDWAEAQTSRNREKALDAVQRLATLLRKGVADQRDWDKLDELAFKQRAKLVEQEVKRQQFQVEVVHLIVVDRILQLLAAIVERNVKDPATVGNIKTELVRVASDAVSSLPGRGRSH